jgi:lipopolysaccharide transport system permease protein
MITDKVIKTSIEKTVKHSGSEVETNEVIIQPSHGWVSLGLRDLWAYRELLYFLAWRDIKVRYKQTVLGASWAILQPFLSMLIFTIFFGWLAQMPSDGTPYPVFTFTALVPWTFFSNGLTQSSNSLVSSANLIKKIYFPRLVVPISVVLAGLPDFMLSFLVLIGMMFYYGVHPNWLSLLYLPPLLLLALVTSLGTGLWFSALNVKYRDVRYIVAFLTQVWMFATPVVYPASLLPARWRTIYGINPMVGVIEGFRWALLKTDAAPGPYIAVSSVTALLILITGMYYFRRVEKDFADLA